MGYKYIFTEQQIKEITEKFNNGIGLVKIGKEYGTSKTPIVKLLKLNNVNMSRGRDYIITENDKINICKKYKNGISIHNLMYEYTKSFRCIKKILDDNNIIIYGMGKKINWSKNDIKNICKMYKNKIKIKEISNYYNVSTPTIRHLLNENNINTSKKMTDEEKEFKKIKEGIRCNIKVMFKKMYYTKSSRTQEILGCDYKFFKEYIENQFEPWMTWENRGKYKKGEYNHGWDFDHIIPISSAKTKDELIKLNHYTNFQPLCCIKNRHDKWYRKDYIIKKG